jgi:hypothetical protein
MCTGCWQLHHPGAQPRKLLVPEREKCCSCGTITRSGLYARINPATVRFPTLTKEQA